MELSLVAGAPQSFIQDVSQPYYGRRPTVSMPQAAQVTPQTHQAAISRIRLCCGGRCADSRSFAHDTRRRPATPAGKPRRGQCRRRYSRRHRRRCRRWPTGSAPSTIPIAAVRPDRARLRGRRRRARRSVRVPHQGAGDAAEEPVRAGANRQRHHRRREGRVVEPSSGARPSAAGGLAHQRQRTDARRRQHLGHRRRRIRRRGPDRIDEAW